MAQDTIVAIASALGESSIAVIRVSGVQAVEIVDRVYQGAQALTMAKSHTVHYGHILSATADEIDEVLVTVMRSPRTYTTEDVVEIGTHGGYQAAQGVLLELLRAGARLAEPGEFTKRAFLGGRVDLAQAEGVMELISAQTSAARGAALKQVEGSLTRVIRSLRERMLTSMARIEVTIDYPEHDEESATAQSVRTEVAKLYEDLEELLGRASAGRILKDGVRIVIVGCPNVGKSSILNQLAGVDRAIVTDIPGTTRDVLQEYLQIGGIPVHVWDTAGIRESEDVVEKIGVQRSREAIVDADLLLIVIDGNVTLTGTDHELLQLARDKSSLVILNKADLPAVVQAEDLLRYTTLEDVVRYSIFVPANQQVLEQRLVDKIFKGKLRPLDASFVANSRHISLLEQSLWALEEVLTGLDDGQTLDLVAVDLRQAWVTLGEIIGETPREDLLDQIFTQFCLGK